MQHWKTIAAALAGFVAGCTSPDPAADGADSTGGSTSGGSDSGEDDASTSSGDPDADSGDASDSGVEGTCDALVDVVQELEAAGRSGVVEVTRGSDVLVSWAGGQCIVEPSTPCTPDSVFDIGSLTKQFTAAAILALQEDGSLTVDDSLAEHFPNVPADKADITLHQLLTHTAGLSPSLGLDYDPIDREAFVELAFASELAFEPGAEHLYSNVGYSILTAIVELSSGGSYEQYLAERLLEPAGLTQTGYVLPEYAEGVVAHGYLGDTSMGAPNEQEWAEDGPHWHLRGNGGLLSNLADMQAWDVALFEGSVLSQASTEAMFTPWADEGFGDSFYGYGWVILDEPGFGRVITHNGGNGYAFAEVARVVDEDLHIVVLTNAFNLMWDELGLQLAIAAVTDCP